MKIIKLLIIMAILTGLIGCHNIDVSVYGEDENVFIRTHRRASNQEATIHFEIGSSENPYNNIPEIEIKLPNGEILNLATLDLGIVEKSFDEMAVSTRTSFSSGSPRKQWENRMPLKHISLRNYPPDLGITLVFQDEKIVYAYFRNNSYKEANPPFQIKSGNSDWYSFPLKKEIIDQLFGKRKTEYSYGDWQ
jgi:hypothetical protein